MIRDEPIFRITDIEQRAWKRFRAANSSGDRWRALTLGRWLVKLNRIGDRIATRSIAAAD